MVEQKIDGSRMHHRRPLNTEHCAEVNLADDIMIDAENNGWITHAAPGAGYTWVVSQVVIGFETQPTGVFHLEMAYDAGAGYLVVFDAYVGGPECAQGTNVSGINSFGFYPSVARKFPANSAVRVMLYSGDAVTASSMNILSWVEMEL